MDTRTAPHKIGGKYEKTSHPNVYLYQGKFKTSYLAFFKGRQITFKTMEEAVAAHSKMQLYGKNALIHQVGEMRGLSAVNVKAIMKALRCRSKAGGIDLKLTADDIDELKDRSRGFCELTNIQFSDKKPEGKRFRPWMPSIDRIDSALPYEMDNCRLVCAYINIAINDLGETEFSRIAMMYLKAKKSKEKII